MSSFDDLWRIGSVSSVPVSSAAGAANSTAAFGDQTRAIQLVWPGVSSSTGGVRIAIGKTPVASSTADALLAVNTVNRFLVSPGERLSAISNDAVAGTLTVVQLTK